MARRNDHESKKRMARRNPTTTRIVKFSVSEIIIRDRDFGVEEEFLMNMSPIGEFYLGKEV